jgi:hypothetical protein
MHFFIKLKDFQGILVSKFKDFQGFSSFVRTLQFATLQFADL